MPITNKIINNVICFTCLIKQDLEIEMDEAISKLLSDDVIVSGDEIEKDDVENEYDEPDNKKKKKKEKLATFECWRFYTRIGVGKQGKEKVEIQL